MGTLRKIFLAIGFWIYPLVGIELFLESSAFLGIFLPGDTVVIFMGVLAGTNVISLWGAIILMVGCVFAGDVGGYLLGRYKGEAILKKSQRAKRHYERRHDQIVGYAQRWGMWIIVIGRFLPFLRAVTPFTMGTAGMKLSRLLPAAAIASLSWCGGFFALGYEFGSHWKELESILEPAGGGIIGAIVIAAIVWFCWHYRERIKIGVVKFRDRMRA